MNCLAMRQVHLPAPARPNRATSSNATKAPSCWTRLAKCLRACRPNCCRCYRSRASSGWAARARYKVDVRILAATNVDVKLAVEQGRLRLDLYYRLNGFNLCLPPLRERREEIVPLFRSFMKHMAVTVHQPERPLSDTCAHLAGTRWPGNLRELHNVVKRYLVLGEESLPGSPVAAGEVRKPERPAPQKNGRDGDLKQIVRELKGEAEAEAIRAALEKTQWRRKEAAALLGICYKALIYKSRQYGIISPREKAVPRRFLPKAHAAC